MTIKTPDPKQLLDTIRAMQAELTPKCFSNCTVDLISILRDVVIITNETLAEIEARFPTMTAFEKAQLWSTLQDPGAINAARSRVPRLHLGILGCQLAVLLAHRGVCESMYSKTEQAPIHKEERRNILKIVKSIKEQ